MNQHGLDLKRKKEIYYRAAEEILRFFRIEFMEYWSAGYQFYCHPLKAWYVSFKTLSQNSSISGLILNKQPPTKKRPIFTVPIAIQKASNLREISCFELVLDKIQQKKSFTNKSLTIKQPQRLLRPIFVYLVNLAQVGFKAWPQSILKIFFSIIGQMKGHINWQMTQKKFSQKSLV